MNFSTYLRAHSARLVGSILSKTFGSSTPIIFQRLVRFCYCPWIGRGDGFLKVIKISNTKNKIELNTNSLVDWQVWCYGTQDYAIEKEILDFNWHEKVFFDIGANFGYYSGLAEGKGAIVYAFEPVSIIYKRLIKINELNGEDRIKTFQLGCGDNRGTTKISLPDSTNPNWGQSSILRQIGNNVEDISIITLDEFCAENQIDKISFIKIDVEGAEHLVLRGSKKILQEYRPIVIFEGNEESLEEVLAILRQNNYIIQKLNSKGSDFIAKPI